MGIKLGFPKKFPLHTIQNRTELNTFLLSYTFTLYNLPFTRDH
jgi:hypothetical protein